MASLAVGEHARMYAQAGVMRAGASRANVHSPLTFVAIAGIQYATARAVDGEQVDNDTLAIDESAGETPNTASFQVRGFVPVEGQDVVITLGSINNLERLFAGTILTDAHSAIGAPENGRDAVNVIDYTWQLTRDTFSQRWTNASGTVIARAIIARANRGFTSLLVEEGLPVLDEFTVTNQTAAQALGHLCERLGATYKATYHKDVRLGLAPHPSQTEPTVLTPASALLVGMEDLVVTRSLGPVITRQPVEGGGSEALAAIPPGDTLLPIDDAGWYNPLGGTVVSGPQRINYTGLILGGGGSLVGVRAAPSVGPSITKWPAAPGLTPDSVYKYAFTFGTAAGESVPSPLTTYVTTQVHTAPTSTPSLAEGSTYGPGSHTPGNCRVVVAFVYDDGMESLTSPVSASVAISSTKNILVSLEIGSARVIGRAVYMSIGASPFYYKTYVPNNTATSVDTWYAYSGSSYLPFGVVDGFQGNIGGVAIGPSGTTYRKVYRTAANGSQLKLVLTFADNTTTGGLDSFADGSLGANAPTTDTSGLSTVTGQVLAGSASLLTAGAGAFAATGGWVRVGAQLVRYTGITGNTLTGIPTSGAGAILATIAYGEHVDVAPALTGIPASGAGSILYPIKLGDPVNLRVVLDDLPAQAILSVMMLPLIDDGVIEGDVIQDGRISETEARARGLATLALRSALDVAIGFQTTDLNAHTGRTQGVNMPAPHPYNLVGSFKVQSASIGNFQPALWPTRTVHGANRLFTLKHLLAAARKATG